MQVMKVTKLIYFNTHLSDFTGENDDVATVQSLRVENKDKNIHTKPFSFKINIILVVAPCNMFTVGNSVNASRTYTTKAYL